jgi:hypothetical protein
MTTPPTSRFASAVDLAVTRSARRPRWRTVGLILAPFVVAVVGLTLSLQAAGSHAVRTTTETRTGPQPVTVTANPTASGQTLAVAGLCVSGVSALAGVGAVVVAVVALRRPRS